ncbi:MAG: prephenate dehydrogenase/arogenate dehydrogenase family protein [Candidatus Kerfeldbacteria bacterium]|nr:prephenate dehydrogenase/arogenate dehydrogenase family protein [Candidatus Kerfeldbacteria bacterium]
MNIAIIGAGRFGTVLQKHLSTDNDVVMVGVEYHSALTSELSECNLIIFAVPNRALAEAVQQWKPLISDTAIIMDVGSVKLLPCQILLEAFPEHNVIGTHPLFGPDSAAESWDGQKMVWCKLHCADDIYNNVQTLFTSRGVTTIETTPEQHDHMMAQTQALVHFIGRALTGLQPQTIATPDYANLLRMMEKVTNDTWELFYDMQNLNPYTKPVRQEFIKNIEKLEQEIKKESQGEKSINEIRSQIDTIDEQIVALVGERFKLAQQIGQRKKDIQADVQDPKRETELYLRMHQLSQQYQVPLEVVTHLYDYLMDQARRMQ